MPLTNVFSFGDTASARANVTPLTSQRDPGT